MRKFLGQLSRRPLKPEILELIREGQTDTEIAKEIGCCRQYVSQVRAKERAKRNGNGRD